MIDPPITLPIVTGSRLPIRKLLQFRFGKSAGVLPTAVQNALAASAFMNKPMEMK